ncbi:hypothetical protein CKM354_000602200 [Cercospora kikuchii]|uniref:Uncharacterized protein n=1 Tax=Cercospora kikuchii TaxID=84275 RepID=A0A9P3FHT4_9PEZI|nr:uncharacterized protein CKM354_000602200 [Cercospora kikuchii]GIZ42765.1 hypothetical protein CKM354_000602200 [Cercospora kikuchii]
MKSACLLLKRVRAPTAASPRSFRSSHWKFLASRRCFGTSTTKLPNMAPMVLDYDRDGNVVGGHTVDELPDRLYSVRPHRTVNMVDSTPRILPGAQPFLDQRGVTPQGQHYPYAATPNLYHQHGLPQGMRNGTFLGNEPALPAPPVQPHQELPPYPSRSPASYDWQGHGEARHEVLPYGHPNLQRNMGSASARYGFVANPLANGAFAASSLNNQRARAVSHASQFEAAGYYPAPQHFTYGQRQQPAGPQIGHEQFQQQYLHNYEPVPYNWRGERSASRSQYGIPYPAETQSMAYPDYRQLHWPNDGRALHVGSDGVYLPVQPPHLSVPYLTPPSSFLFDNADVDPRMLTAHTAGRVASESEPAAHRSSDAMPPPSKARTVPRSSLSQVSQYADDKDIHSVGDGDGSDAEADSKKSEEDAYVPPKSPEQSKKKSKSKTKKKKKKGAATPAFQRCADCRARHKKCTHKSRPFAMTEAEASEILASMPTEAPVLQKASPAPESNAEEVATPADGTSIADPSIASFEASPQDVGDDKDTTIEDVQRTNSPEPVSSDHTPVFAYADFLDLENIEQHDHDERQSNESDEDNETPAEHVSDFLNSLQARLDVQDSATLEQFLKDADLYKTGILDEQDFYSNTYKLLHRADMPELLPEFVECLLPSWDEAALASLNARLDRELGEAAVSDAVPTESKLDSLDVTPPVKRKKRPLNAFKASEDSDMAHEEADDAPEAEPSTAAFVRATPPGSPKSSVYARSAKLSDGRTPAPPQEGRKPRARGGKASPKKKSKPAGTTKSFGKPKHQIGHLYSTEVDHVGPVYPTRRALMSRTTRPYIHGPCGKGFAHPQDVRSHHHNGADTKKNCPLGAGHEWDEHPSCKVGQSDLNYATVKDGFVFMDQESRDKLHNAIALGEAEPSRLKGTTRIMAGEMDDEDEDESDHDAEHETDDEYEDFTTTEHTALPYPPTEESASLAPVPTPTPAATLAAIPAPVKTPNPRKRAASNISARAQKRTIVKAGSDEMAVKDNTTTTTPPAPASFAHKKSNKKAATELAVEHNGTKVPRSNVASRAAALGLRARQ